MLKNKLGIDLSNNYIDNISSTQLTEEREKDIELGRSYPFGKLSEGECLAHKNLISDGQKEFYMHQHQKLFIIMNGILNQHFFQVKKIALN